MDVVLEVSHLRKSYPTGFLHTKRRLVIGDLSFSVNRGEIFGFLGPNGSGKTTTLKAIMGLVFPDSGSITVLGHAFADHAWRRRVGFLPEHPYFYDSALTCLQAPGTGCIPNYNAGAPTFLDLNIANYSPKSGYNRTAGAPGTAPVATGCPQVVATGTSIVTCSPTAVDGYSYVTTPVSRNRSGVRGFAGGTDGVICFNPQGAAPGTSLGNVSVAANCVVIS